MNREIFAKLDRDTVQNMRRLTHIIEEHKNIVLSSHISPDGDNLGSIFAMAEYLMSIDKNVSIVNEDPVPTFLRFLPHSGLLVQADDLTPDSLHKHKLCIILDSGELDRIGKVKALLRDDCEFVNIDHHNSNDDFAKINIVLKTASATAEILYLYFRLENIQISHTMAINIFTGIATDTGFFKYEMTSALVHHIAADLIGRGVRSHEIFQNVYQKRPASFLKLLSRALEHLKLYENNLVAIATLSFEDFEEIQDTETDGIIEHLGVIDTVEVYILIREKEKSNISVSLRSKNFIDVSKVASSLGGGGHIRAAGCRKSDSSIEYVLNKLLDEIHLQLLKQ